MRNTHINRLDLNLLRLLDALLDTGNLTQAGIRLELSQPAPRWQSPACSARAAAGRWRRP